MRGRVRLGVVFSMAVLGLVASAVAIVAQTPPANSLRPPAQLFNKVLPALKAKTRVPILLPSELPAPLQEADIHFVDSRGESEEYEVVLYYEEFSGNAGLAGYIEGVTNRPPSKHGKEVTLVNGIKGHFRAKSCGGSCSPSLIEWTVNGAVYTTQLKLVVATVAEEETRMIAVANSAIQGGPR